MAYRIVDLESAVSIFFYVAESSRVSGKCAGNRDFLISVVSPLAKATLLTTCTWFHFH
jgi:hypothetical protein